MSVSNYLENRTRHLAIYLKTFLRWIVFAVLMGILCGLVGTAFHFCVEFATNSRLSHGWLLYCLPLSGMLIVLIYHLSGVTKDEGTNLVINSVKSSHRVPWNMAFLIFVGTVLTHLCGGSAGREGAALQIGGSLGSDIARIFHVDQEDSRMMITIGMAGLFSALFGTPLTAAIFSMEVIMVGAMNYAVFLPSIVCAATASALAHYFGVESIDFTFVSIPYFDSVTFVRVGILAILCAFVSYGFVKVMHFSGHTFSARFKNQYVRVFVGGSIIVVLSLLSGTRMYNGVGMDTIQLCMAAGHVVWYAFLMKIIFTAITMGSGFKGGEIIPSFFIGATLGNVLAPVLGIDPAFAAAIGLISVFCSVVNCPMAAVILSIELFGGKGILYFALACAVCFIASGYTSLYATQDFMFQKIPENLKGEEADDSDT